MDGTPTVLLEGGARRSLSPERDTFAVLAESAAGELGPVVAACPACGAPMVADLGSELQRIPWTLPTPRGPIVFGADGTVSTPDGPSLEAAGQLVAAAHPLPSTEDSAAYSLYRGSIFLMFLAPVAVWLVAVFFVVLFLSRVGTSVPVP